jgi:hypothetical protein
MYDVRWKREDVGLSSSFLSRIGEFRGGAEMLKVPNIMQKVSIIFGTFK